MNLNELFLYLGFEKYEKAFRKTEFCCLPHYLIKFHRDEIGSSEGVFLYFSLKSLIRVECSESTFEHGIGLFSIKHNRESVARVIRDASSRD